jgi:hypothetical protein
LTLAHISIIPGGFAEQDLEIPIPEKAVLPERAVLLEKAVLNRMKKQKLQDLCHDHGVDFDENETRAMLITKLTNLN